MMEVDEVNKEQEQCTAKLVISTFNKLLAEKDDGVGAADITQYLQEKFGNVWREDVLQLKAEHILNRGTVLGFLNQLGEKYVPNLDHDLGPLRRRRSSHRKCGARRSRRRRRSCPLRFGRKEK